MKAYQQSERANDPVFHKNRVGKPGSSIREDNKRRTTNDSMLDRYVKRQVGGRGGRR